jgi:large subunit ribosomal protein L34e
MLPAKLKSRTFRRIFTRTPSGKVVIHYKKKKNGVPKCAMCKKPLFGVVRGNSTVLKNTAKSKKKPERPFGGNLCTSCMRKVYLNKVLNSQN